MDFEGMLGNLEHDHLIIVFIGYLVVFISLSILSVVFYNVPRILNLRFKRESEPQTPTPTSKHVHDFITGEETAAISAAIYFFVEELHDDEHTVLTIQKISKRYSPWNSKIYGVTNGLNKRF